MTSRRIWIARSPLDCLPEIVLTEDRWTGHVVVNHPEMAGKEGNAWRAVTQPTAVVAGRHMDTHVVFVNRTDTSLSGSPMSVVVNRLSGIVVTALFDRRYATFDTERVIWPKR